VTLFDLSQVFIEGMPQSRALTTPYTFEEIRIPSPHEHDGCVQFSRITTMSHIGTHVDAPIHFLQDGPAISDLTIDRFAGFGVILDVPKGMHEAVSVADLEASGQIVEDGDIVFVRTGWGAYYHSDTASTYVKHPYYLPEVADWVVKRRLKIFGTDTITPDPPHKMRSADYKMDMHVKLLSTGTLVIENLNLESVPHGRCKIYAFPLNLQGGDGSPARVVAEFED
jgi:arylformamidase